MSYYFECETCGATHPVRGEDIDGSNYSELPERVCDGCGESGCVDCIHGETRLCAVCDATAEAFAQFEEDHLGVVRDEAA